jgi:FtsP/CotA-like multicopper oxidase with cupredoxin domain
MRQHDGRDDESLMSGPFSRSRRRLLLVAASAGAALPFFSVGAPAGPAAVEHRITASRNRTRIVPAPHPETDVWCYGSGVPGPEIRVRQGARLRVDVHNRLDVETTVHWHGIRLPNAMDGVPHLTQPPIAANGGRFVYEFDLPDAGTYWYHPHLGSPEQVGRGLYGALIVEERDPPRVDRDVIWVISDWRLDRGAQIVGDFRSFMDSSHAGRIGNTVTVNGAVHETFSVRSGERIRLRLINASNARIYSLAFEGHEPWLIAFDGQPLEPRPLVKDNLVLGPAQRADLIIDCRAGRGSRRRVVDGFYPRQAYRLMDLTYSADAPIGGASRPVAGLPANPYPRPDLVRPERHRIVFGGGMMGAMPSQRDHKGMFWTVNGTPVPEDHHHHAPLMTLRRGRSCIFELVNDTRWHHPIHIHGHVFSVVSRNGKPDPRGESGDTVLLDPQSRAEIAFVADNPGDWMLHCHVLEHQATGMMATVRVT